MPWLFTSSWGATGVIAAPDVELLCAFPADSGSGGHPNGRCGDVKVGTEWFYAQHGAEGGGWPIEATLKDALGRQYDGSYRKTHYGASAYNEVPPDSTGGARVPDIAEGP